MDYIHLNDLEFYGFHGALPEETKLGQIFRVTITLACDLKRAGETDNLEETVNYAEVFELCKEIVEGKPYLLIEAVAEKIASSILHTYAAKVSGCRIQLVKPNPPIVGHYASVAVDITRGAL
ncbi:dihydroneopterin aldolase [Psychrobacillus sp. FSL K6-2836]|uniref:dihydroneopterin aldolase n=1 Tax=Psychrobacillus sp. FSL K6-2836 TaxID=2921548 RepID=UPI0030FB01BE